jgi:hypothetical protein
MTRLDRSAATVLRLCQLAQLPRATYYRSLEAKAPRAADMEMRSLIHAISLANRHYGYPCLEAPRGGREWQSGSEAYA